MWGTSTKHASKTTKLMLFTMLFCGNLTKLMLFTTLFCGNLTKLMLFMMLFCNNTTMIMLLKVFKIDSMTNANATIMPIKENFLLKSSKKIT